MELVEKEVDFMKYCPECIHYKKKDYEDPCNECLDNGMNLGTTKPVKFERKA